MLIVESTGYDDPLCLHRCSVTGLTRQLSWGSRGTGRPAASRGNAYLRPDALTGEKRDRYMMFGNFDCANAGGERMTQVPDTSDAPSCFVQNPPAWPPGNTRPYPHIDAADYSKP